MENKVLVIGIDALDPKIIDKLELSNLKNLETYSRLETTIPPETPVAWSAASTGTNPGKYGIFDFISRDIKTYLLRLNLATEEKGIMRTKYSCAMKGIPFWRILSQNNIQSSIIRWPVTFPAEKINGNMLSGLGVVDIKGLLNQYSFYTNGEIRDEEGKEKVIPIKIQDNLIKTHISGPLIKRRGVLEDIKIPMDILIKEDSIIIKIQDKEYLLSPKQWSKMIKVNFKIYLMNVPAIFQIYLESIKPIFKMYFSSMQIDPEEQIIDITSPKEYGKELVNNIGLFHTLGMPEDTKAVTENKINEKVFLEQIQQIELERKKMFFYEFERFKKGVLAFVFDSGDRLQHIFWDNESKENNVIIPKEIEDYYKEKDKFIGQIIPKLDKETKLIIFSDHGFNNFKRQVNINSWLVKEGFMNIKNNSNFLLDFVDWNKTQAYSLGFTSLYLNLKQRERDGIVNPDEKEDLINDIINRLKRLSDNSGRVFTNIYKGEEIYKGQYSFLAPDIVLGFSPGYRMSWKNSSGGLDKEIIFDNNGKWKGDHLIDRSHVPGVLFTNFKINKINPSILDICPTIIKLFNIKNQEFDGIPLI